MHPSEPELSPGCGGRATQQHFYQQQQQQQQPRGGAAGRGEGRPRAAAARAAQLALQQDLEREHEGEAAGERAGPRGRDLQPRLRERVRGPAAEGAEADAALPQEEQTCWRRAAAQPGCVSSGGRVSPTESLAYVGGEEPLRPSQSLADRMRGRLDYVNKKMRIIRSRSAERLRGVIRTGGGGDTRPGTPDTEAAEHSGGGQLRAARSRGRDPRSAARAADYSGPVLGTARATVSCVPSPYDTDVLGFQAGDTIEVLQMNPSGLWRGRCGGRVGQFKFINVELLPARRRKRSSSRSLRKMRASQSRPPGTIAEVVRMLDMAEHLPVFVLNGYEDLTLFKDLDDDELDYLGITNLKQRQKLIDMANLLFPDEKSPGEGDSSDSSDSEDSSSESGIADINSDEAYSSYNSNKHN